MTTIIINNKNHSIEMPSKKYALAASKYGSDEYMEVQNARRDYPNYKVVTKATKRNDPLKGITYKKMEDHINANDAGSENEKYFKKITDKESPDSKSYGAVKSWVIKTYFPEYVNKKSNEKTQSSANVQ